MSWQTEAFAELIEQARQGNEEAIPPIREMVERAARSAPPAHLLRIAEVILGIGREMSDRGTESD